MSAQVTQGTIDTVAIRIAEVVLGHLDEEVADMGEEWLNVGEMTVEDRERLDAAVLRVVAEKAAHLAWLRGYTSLYGDDPSPSGDAERACRRDHVWCTDCDSCAECSPACVT